MATATATRNWSDQFRSSFQEIEINPLEEGATALMYACQQENVEQLQSILRKKPEAVRERDRTLKTVLHYCAENHTLDCAEIILSVAPDIIDVADEDGYTTLHLAVIGGNIPLVNFLISKNADINALDSERHSVIHWATVCGEVELLEILLKCGANPSTPDVQGGYPIHYAAQMCGASSEMKSSSKLGLTVLKVLLNHDVDVNVVDHDGRQPVLWAASAGSSDASIALINAGASVHAYDKDGLTALHCAASRGHTDCLETLIELCAADVDVIDNNGCSPLFYSVTLGHADATQLLLRCGADPNRQDRKGRTPAHCGAAKGQFETLRILKKHDGNLWIRNVKGDYCLQEAVNSGRKDLVKWLLSQRPDAVNASNADGRCPLHVAAMGNNIEMCKILLDYQSLVNPIMRTNKGDLMTPLDAALHKGNRGCAKYLQLHGGVPASKLTSYSAALRGPHKVEIHSDYQGSPEGKLDTPYQTRGSRSLDTSPSGYQSSRSRKVHVRIRADVTSKKIEESFPDDRESYHKHRRKYDVEIDRHPKTSSRKHNRMVDDYSITSDSYSSSDKSDYSSDTERRTRGRRRRRRWHGDERRYKREPKIVSNRSRQSSRSRSQSKCRCSDEESHHRERSQHREESKMKVTFRDTSDDDLVVKKSTEFSSRSELSVGPPVHHKVTAVVHREAEEEPQDTKESKETKPSESSENGYQEVQYQKLDTGTEVTDTDVFTDSGKADEKKKQTSHPSKSVAFSPVDDSQRASPAAATKSKRDSPRGVQNENAISSVDPFGDQPFTASKLQKEETTETIHATANEPQKQESDMQSKNIENVGDISIDSKTSTANRVDSLKKDVDEEKISQGTPKIARRSSKSQTSQEEDVKSAKIAEEKSMRDDKRAEEENMRNAEQQPETTTKEEKKLEKRNSTEEKAEDKPPPVSGLQKTIQDLEKFKIEQLEEHFTKDKGLICVILDDDETIEIKRRKESRTKSEHSTHRTRSASRKKDKNLLKRQRRSRSSFEVLSDEGDKEMQSSRLNVHDDSGFEPSPRHGSSTFEDVSNKVKSRIPRATNRYQSEKQKENDPNINVSSVTQAVQNSLRKYHLERKVFHTLLEMKRLQIRAGKSNEQVLVKRLVDDYQKAGLIVGLRPYDGIYSFRHFERYLYEQLRILQSTNRKDIPRIKSSDDFEKLTKALRRTRAGKTLLENVPDNPLFCTHGTHRCIHATHAYTGIPCAAYIAKLDHHKLPKTTENYRCFLPRIDVKQVQRKTPSDVAKSLRNVDPTKPVTLELIHGTEKQIIALPTEKLDKNKRYYVTFTIKGGNNEEKSTSDGEKDLVVTQTTEENDCRKEG